MLIREFAYEYMTKGWQLLSHYCVLFDTNPSNQSIELIQLLVLRLSRYCMSKHEYINQLQRIHIILLKIVETIIQLFPVHCYVIVAGFVIVGNIYNHLVHTQETLEWWCNHNLNFHNKFDPQYTELSSVNTEINKFLYWYGYDVKHEGAFIGGGLKTQLTFSMIKDYIISDFVPACQADCNVKFIKQTTLSEAHQQTDLDLLYCYFPLDGLRGSISIREAKEIAKLHGIQGVSRKNLEEIGIILGSHLCKQNCVNLCTVFTPVKTTAKTVAERQKSSRFRMQEERPQLIIDEHNTDGNTKQFPPTPPSQELLHKIIKGFTDDCHPTKFMEAGCMVCGQLCPISELTAKNQIQYSLKPLYAEGVTRMERKTAHDPIADIGGPVLDTQCEHICTNCIKYLKKGIRPPLSLANGFWLGKIPIELSCLTYVEKLLISRVRHNRCIVKVASGRYKMRANAITFQNPVPKIYDILPPPVTELDDVLAFIFTGPCQPTRQDIERTPLLVRRNHVAHALEWLKLNHSDYKDVGISAEHLEQYPENDAPVVIDYRESVLNKDREATSVHDIDEEDGVENGPCSFVVQGLTGEEYSTMSIDAIKAHALEHLTNNKKIMFVGHSKDPLTIFKNPRLFPSMLPWLFPYGLGGLGREDLRGKMSTLTQKQHLLMYHDKRFQTDPNFPLIAFNHEQIQQSTTGGFLTAKKEFFGDVASRLVNIDLTVLSDISTCLSSGEHHCGLSPCLLQTQTSIMSIFC